MTFSRFVVVALLTCAVPVQACLPGWDCCKWNDPEHQTPKYMVGRLLMPYEHTPDGLRKAMPTINIAFPGSSILPGKGDKAHIACVGVIDLIEAAGRIERLSYDAEVRTQDYFATAFLHRVLKAVIMEAMPALEAWGIHDLTLGGLDLQHTGQEYPHAVFTRALTLAFQYVFNLHEPQPRLRAIDGALTATMSDSPAATLSWQVTIA